MILIHFAFNIEFQSNLWVLKGLLIFLPKKLPIFSYWCSAMVPCIQLNFHSRKASPYSRSKVFCISLLIEGQIFGGRQKCSFDCFFPRAHQSSIGLSPPSGIYHQKIRIMIVWAHVWLASLGSNDPVEVFSDFLFVFFYLLWIKNCFL